MTLQKATLKAVELIKKNKRYINNVELCYGENGYFRLAADNDYEGLFENLTDGNSKELLKFISVDLKRWLPLENILGNDWYVRANIVKSINVGRKDVK